MAEQTLVVDINGYWRDQQRKILVENSGIFFVYEAKYNDTDQTVDLLRIIYIGHDASIGQFLLSSELRQEWLQMIEPGNELCYATAAVDNYYRTRVAAAYIFAHLPPVNKEYTTAFPFDRTTIISTGKTALLYPVITATRSTLQKTDPPGYMKRRKMIPARAIPLLKEPEKPMRFASGE
jgi:hypothetical protein